MNWDTPLDWFMNVLIILGGAASALVVLAYLLLWIVAGLDSEDEHL